MIGAQIVPVVWSQRLHRVKTYCLSQSYLSFALTARTTGSDNCRVRQARLHSPCGLAQPMNTVPLMKRAMDITGSLIALVLLPPVLLVIALAIKLTSKGLSFLGRRGSDNMANSLSFPPVSFLNRPRMNL
jgi:hypothetical protein